MEAKSSGRAPIECKKKHSIGKQKFERQKRSIANYRVGKLQKLKKFENLNYMIKMS